MHKLNYSLTENDEFNSKSNCKSSQFLSQPNNNHNSNNKTTISVVGLRQSNCWEPPPTTRNSKLHDRAEMEQNLENKSYQSILGDPKTVFEPYLNPKNSPLGHQNVKNDPKIKSKSNVRIEG